MSPIGDLGWSYADQYAKQYTPSPQMKAYFQWITVVKIGINFDVHSYGVD